jgi:hypothetical protein
MELELCAGGANSGNDNSRIPHSKLLAIRNELRSSAAGMRHAVIDDW